MSENGLTLSEKDIVTRLLEQGVVVSTDRLGKMSGTQWGVMSSSIKEMPVVRMLSWFARAKNKHYAVRFSSNSALELEFLILFSDKSATAVTAAVIRKYADKMKHLKNIVELTIGEVSNVVAQSVLGALADEYDVSIILSVPAVSSGDKAVLMSGALDTFDARKDTLLLSHVDMYSENLSAECSMVIMVNTQGMKKLLCRPVAS